MAAHALELAAGAWFNGNSIKEVKPERLAEDAMICLLLICLWKKVNLSPFLSFLLSISALLSSPASRAAAAETYDYDVVVVGGSEAGVAAAVTAARNGSRVAIWKKPTG